ncbi:MAG: hypothetical protein ACXIUM_07700 [Wenzhouxiangella sp.]
MAEAQPLQNLLQQRADLWRGRRRPAGQSVSSGRADLDAWLPDGGWPRASLVELLPRYLGDSELELLLPLLAEQTRQGWPVLLLAPPLIPCPQRLHHAGIALDRVVIARDPSQALWAAEQALKSGVCGSVMTWHPKGRVDARAIRRLQLAARNSAAPSFICYRPGQTAPPSLSALRLGLQSGPELILLRGNGPERRLHLGRGNVVPLRRPRPAQRPI